MKPDPRDVKKILVVTLSNLGDVVLTLPVFQALVEAYPAAALDVVVGPGGKDVFEGDVRLRRVMVHHKKASLADKIRFIREVRRERYDILIDLRRSPIGFFGGAKIQNSYFTGGQKIKHRALKHFSALRGIVDSFPAQGFLRVPASEKISTLGLNDGPRLVVAAVGSKSDTKKWPEESYARLLDRLAINDGFRVVLVGDKNDASSAAKVAALMKAETIDLAGQTNFAELCAVLKNAALLVTNDSAPLHIADALKVPVLAIFGPTDPRKYGPRSDAGIAVQKPVFCVPCEKAQCRFDRECMKELVPDEVYRRALEVLNDQCWSRTPKILVTRLDRIGDVVLSLPAIAAIRERFPNAWISLMVRPFTESLVQGHPLIDEVIPYCYEKKGRHRSILGNFRFLREIIRRHFDIAFILHPGHRSVLVPFLAGIPYRIGFDSADSFGLTKAVSDRRHQGSKHESEYALDLVRAFGVAAVGNEPFLEVSKEEEIRLDRKLESLGVSPGDSFLALHPSASCPSKRWPKENFAALGKKITVQAGHRIAILGAASDAATAEFLCAEIGSRTVSLAGRLDLAELKTFLKRCGLLVSNDSGPVHVAAAVGVKTVVIFGRNKAGLSARRWRPLGEGHVIIQKDVGCVVCLAHRCTINFECLQAVSVEEVFESTCRVLSDSEKAKLSYGGAR